MKLTTTIAHHKLAILGGGGAAAFGWWHYRTYGTWLPSSMTGAASGQAQSYTPGQQQPFTYLPGGVEPVNTNGGYATGSGGNGMDSGLLKILQALIRDLNNPKKKPKPKKPPKGKKNDNVQDRRQAFKHGAKYVSRSGRVLRKPPAPHGSTTGGKRGDRGGSTTHHHNRNGHGGGKHSGHQAHRDTGGVPPNRRTHQSDRVKYGASRPGNYVQRPTATTTGGGHATTPPAPRPSAPPPRNANRTGRQR